jgi:hypothetical protein
VLQVHGEVSREPAAWAAATVEEGALTEVIYEKAEGIAKVRRCCWRSNKIPASSQPC